MGILEHWHPVLRANDVKHAPVAVRIGGEPIAVFRTASGGLGAVADVCPHRRLKLSVGAVVGERLQCRYHGWTFDTDGKGESPGTPKLTTCATSYDVRESTGLIWIKGRGQDKPLPDLSCPGFLHICTLQHVIPAPLELAVDNFNEIEHSGTVHSTFGYDLDRMSEVKVRYETTETTVRVINSGPTKRLNRLFALPLGIRSGDLFHDDWTTHFSPVYSVFDHWWTSPDGRREGMVRWRLYIFFIPIDDTKTLITSVTYAKSRYPGPGGGLRLVRWLFRRKIDEEIRADVGMLDHLADYGSGIEGMKLSRFDKALGLTRDRIQSIYRGESALALA